MKKYLYLFFLSTLLFAYSCDNGDSVSTNGNTDSNGTVKVMNNASGGELLSATGSKLLVPAGSIGLNDQNENGNVTFSIEDGISQSELPLAIPYNYELIGSVVKFSPSNFNFSQPIWVYLSASSLTDLDAIFIIRYNEKVDKWEKVPISDVDADNKRLGCTSFELGYFAVIRDLAEAKKISQIEALRKSGGIRMTHSAGNEYYYTIMVVGFTPKYPEDATINMNGTSGGTGNQLGGTGPRTVTHLGGIPQGTYALEISRVKAGTMFSLPGQREYYSTIIQAQVGGFGTTCFCSMESWQGWTDITLTGGSWQPGNPTYWPESDKPYGTGDFQATLTWTNIDNSVTDIDLHLFGPNGIHIYYENRFTFDNSISLDRDWQEELGSAVENIFSTGTMPSGNYKIYVNLFSGTTPKSCEVRIIRKGTTVKTYRKTLSVQNSEDIESKMTLIESFNI